MNWKKWTKAGLACVFIAGNTYLIVQSDSPIKRSNAVDEWTAVKQEDLVSTKKAKGIIMPTEEQHIYLDQNVGTFGKFLVSEGDEVQAGTPLFEYSSVNGEARKQQLEAESTRLEKEISGIDASISELEDLIADLPNKTKSEKESKRMLEASIKQDIQNKELQKSRLQAEADKYEDLITAEEDHLSNLTVTSEIDGVVKSVSQDLKNPVVTIASNDQQIEGVLKEKELRSVAEEMKVYAYSESAKQKIEGTISKIASLPVGKVEVKKESEYPFIVTLNENVEGLIHGSHVQMNIIRKEELGALTLPASVIDQGKKNSYVYELKENGVVEKRKIEEGLRLGDRQGLASGVSKNQIVAAEPNKIVKGSSYFTPLKVERLNKKNLLTEIRKKDILRYIGKGFLAK
ncbi:efflux RND transporter periplasmic adaptor subunit [Bacillus massilinigeriensis]|uniref:efflux RND transporter periplasmic adaptor subunit n=1 Tax=Bacillus massilionigeriensis TaxID=1805475 RepID=UPI00096B3AB2|nr:HlyD family efflux transporter periplasmic adaptor subunit [Bacillus massilionigeriensis]